MCADIFGKKEGRWCVVVCPALNTVTQGRNVPDARYMITEATLLVIDSCRERGTLPRVLHKCASDKRRRRTVPRKSDWDGDDAYARGWKRIGKIRLPVRLP